VTRAGQTAPGPERTAIYEKMARLVAAYAPVKLHSHRKYNYMLQPWTLGWRQHPILLQGYRYVDIDLERRHKALAR